MSEVKNEPGVARRVYEKILRAAEKHERDNLTLPPEFQCAQTQTDLAELKAMASERLRGITASQT